MCVCICIYDVYMYDENILMLQDVVELMFTKG